LGYAFLFEVPKYTLRQATYGGVYVATQLHGDVVTGKHDFIDTLVDVGFVLFDPSQLGSGKIAR